MKMKVTTRNEGREVQQEKLVVGVVMVALVM